MGAATLAVIQGDFTAAAAAGEEAASLSRAAGDLAGLSHALQYLGFDGRVPRGSRPGTGAAHRSGAGRRRVWVTLGARLVVRIPGALAESLSEDGFVDAGAHADRAEQLIGPDGDQELLAWVSLIRGMSAWGLGRTSDAARQSSRARRSSESWAGCGAHLGAAGRGIRPRHENEGRHAVRAFSAAKKLRETAGTGVQPFVEGSMEAALERLRGELDVETFDAEWAAGERYTLAEALRTTETALTTY